MTSVFLSSVDLFPTPLSDELHRISLVAVIVSLVSWSPICDCIILGVDISSLYADFFEKCSFFSSESLRSGVRFTLSGEVLFTILGTKIMCMSRSFEISFSSGRKIEVHSAVEGYMLNTEKLLSLISNMSSMFLLSFFGIALRDLSFPICMMTSGSSAEFAFRGNLILGLPMLIISSALKHSGFSIKL